MTAAENINEIYWQLEIKNQAVPKVTVIQITY